MNIATAVAAFTVPLSSLGMVIAIVWLIARARQRRNELRADVQMKLIEKFGSSTEFVHFLESQAGRDFLHQPMMDTRRRVIGGITAGTVLTIMGLGFSTTEYVDVSGQLETKVAMLEAHQSQLTWLRDHDGIDIVEQMKTTTRFRGLQCGVQYAEGFAQCLTWLRGTTRRLLP